MIIELMLAAMMTPFGEKVTAENAWREYPRPQLVRENWTCLNGQWDYAVTSVTNTPGRPQVWAGKILVPFALESQLSGVGRQLKENEFLWYTRKIDVKKRAGFRNLLHFDGVDFRAMVFIGHREVDLPHSGAQEPFTLDITEVAQDGVNDLTVCVWDPTEGFINSRGKQTLDPKGCHYTRVSGIWQSVWMETVPETYIDDYTVVTDIDSGKVTFGFKTVGKDRDDEVEVEVLDAEGRVIAKGEEDAQKGVTIRMPAGFALWSPENPMLYAFRAKLEKDVIMGYFGMRKIEKRKDKDGYLRFFFNNKPCYLIGTLDQGWWPDGLLTPPSDAAMTFDIMTLKSCGFNMMRKHIKVEPRRYYYLCDKLGIIVLQDLPCNMPWYNQHRDDGVVRDYGFQRLELKRMIDELQKVPSIVMWVPYNEGWSQPGEFLTHTTLDWVKNYDSTRLVNGPSGCNDWEGGHILPQGWDWDKRVWTKHKPAGECEASDTVDMHHYRGPSMFEANDRRISFLGEFGGLGHPVKGHLWKEVSENWGYGGVEDTKTREGLEKTYLELQAKVEDLARKGLGGSVYTQTTDVEVEINGLMTYDRKVLKFDAAKLKAAHDKIRAVVEK